MSLVKPVLQALVLAERIWEDKDGRKIIGGTFNVLWFTDWPLVKDVETPSGETQRFVQGGMNPGAPYAYISLTDVCDNTEIELQFVSLTKNVVIFSSSIVVHCNSRLATIEIVAPLPPLPIHHEGVYAFEIVCEGEVIGSHRIIAKKHPDQKDRD